MKRVSEFQEAASFRHNRNTFIVPFIYNSRMCK